MGRLLSERPAHTLSDMGEIERLSGRTPRPLTGARLSARNRMPGIVRSVFGDLAFGTFRVFCQ